MKKLIKLSLAAAVMMVASDQALALGPGVSGLERDEKIEEEVRRTLKEIRAAAQLNKQARSEWLVDRAKVNARVADAKATLEECKRSNPKTWERECRLHQASVLAAEEEQTETLLKALERYEAKFGPLAKSIQSRVHYLVLDERRYRHLLAQSDAEGSESKLLRMLMISLDQSAKLRTKLTESITRILLGDLLKGISLIEEDMAVLAEMTPEIDQLIEDYEFDEGPRDRLAAHTYPSMD